MTAFVSLHVGVSASTQDSLNRQSACYQDLPHVFAFPTPNSAVRASQYHIHRPLDRLLPFLSAFFRVINRYSLFIGRCAMSSI